MPRRSKKEIERMLELEKKIPCAYCKGTGVYEAGFKYWKTCPECHGDKYV